MLKHTNSRSTTADEPSVNPPTSRHWLLLGEPLVIGVLITLVLFGGYELVERLWLSDLLDVRRLHLLHLLRGIASSLVVAGTVGWMVLRNSPGFWVVSAGGREDRLLAHVSPEERYQTYARWFIAMRWTAVVFAACLVFISVRLVKWLPEEVWRPLMGMVLALAALNVVYTLLLRHPRWVSRLLPLQAYLDLCILALLLHFSGGIENPLSMMMLFHVIIGGILLSRRQCYGLAAAASLLFALMAWAEWGEFIEHYTLQLFPHVEEVGAEGQEAVHMAHHSLYVLSRIVLQVVVLFLSGYFVTTLAERLRDNERRLEIMADRATAGQQLLEQALETTGSALRVLDRTRQVFWANQQWRDWFDQLAKLDQRAVAALDGDNCPADRTLANGEPHVTELVIGDEANPALPSGGNDHYRVFQITTAPLAGPDGGIQRVVELAQDITDQKRAQAQMMRAGKLAAVGELAGRVAHEVNNPIAIISAKLRLLLSLHRQDMSEKTAKEIAKATDQADRVARIAQGLLSYCRPSAATRTRLDLRQPLRKSLAMVEQHARKAGVTVVEELPEHLPSVEANAGELEQVFLNLFLNALDAMPQGGSLTIATAGAASLADGQPGVAVHVQDTGTGIPSDIRDRIFEPFFTTKGEGRGTGLGLSICQGLIRSHGGEITVESKPGDGTVFTLTLPIPDFDSTA